MGWLLVSIARGRWTVRLVTAMIALGVVQGLRTGAPHGTATNGFDGAGRGGDNVSNEFVKFALGHWLDCMGNSILVFERQDEKDVLTVVRTPLVDAGLEATLTIRRVEAFNSWKLGSANLELLDKQRETIVWMTADGRRSVWHRSMTPEEREANVVAFPWMVNNAEPELWRPSEIPRDILYDGARISALLDIRQMIGPHSEPQEMLTHILMDHDLYPALNDYLVPDTESPLWQSLNVSESLRQRIKQRIDRIPLEVLSQRVHLYGETEVWVGHHKIGSRPRDVRALDARWMHKANNKTKRLEIGRLIALYSIFDNPLSNKRNGVHLGVDPELRRQSDYELFASPLNAAVPNGRFASKWPHVEWRFGSIGSYPSVLQFLPHNAIVCVNPPFTDSYLADVMARISDIKNAFRLRLAMPIMDRPWRKKLYSSFPGAELLQTYYDASAEKTTDLLHPTLIWEDPRCPKQGRTTSVDS